METLIHADIFFFVSTIALIVISLAILALVIVAIYLVQETRACVKMVSEKAEHAWADWKELEATLMKRFGIFKILKKLFKKFVD